MMRARKVSRDQLKTIGSEEWVDHSRSPFVDGDECWVPVREGMPFDRDIGRQPQYAGRGFYLIGDVAVIHGDRPAPAQVDEIVRFRNPRGVLWIESLHEVTRTPQTEILFGTVGEVRHRESGYTFILDPRKVMFSQGNRTEKMRIADLIRAGPGNERVADMFAGIGYFSLPAAGAGARVHAMEINPVAFGYLERNIRENPVPGLVEANLGDCRKLLSGTYDRILMGHFDAITMFASALHHVKTGSVIHLHSIGPAGDQIHAALESAGFSATIQVHKVKKYRPHAWHVVQDVRIV
ncbi:class I SAM-dependent methyltransferase [Methanoregula sp.]|jgi:tRNA wybutosine-synthesizing protein 2|uniref:class I SAM-dependent methyltransferase n=1 Tax=Methanoregula sp. TaxID=2052170 RepID=UPI003C233109